MANRLLDSPINEKWYSFSTQLLYPSALGAAIGWFFQAFGRNIFLKPDWNTFWWSVLFASWFIVYHSVWFIHRVAVSKPKQYHRGELLSDSIDAVALTTGVWALGFASAAPNPAMHWLVFAAAALIPLASLLPVGKRRKWPTFLPRGLAESIALSGVFYNWWKIPTNGTTCVDWALLLALVGILVWYIVRPEHFGSDRGNPTTTEGD